MTSSGTTASASTSSPVLEISDTDDDTRDVLEAGTGDDDVHDGIDDSDVNSGGNDGEIGDGSDDRNGDGSDGGTYTGVGPHLIPLTPSEDTPENSCAESHQRKFLNFLYVRYGSERNLG
jgi:hypothetical protein